MQSSKEVVHSGIVQEVGRDFVKVSILAQSACAACKAKGMCGVSEMKEKIIEVVNKGYSVSSGDTVKVVLSQALGFRALFLGYLLPFIILMITLVTAIFTIKDEGISALLALGVLVPYYLILYRYRDKIKNKFSFSLRV